MPRKIPRSSSTSLSKISQSGAGFPISGRPSEMLAASIAYGQTVQAAAVVFAASANLVASTVKSLAVCADAFFNYLAECQRTRQVEIWSVTVIAEARERTRQMEIQAEALIFAASQETRRVEIEASVTMEQLRDTQEAREARMEIVRNFLDQHHRLHQVFISQSEWGLRNLTVDERVNLTKYRDAMLQRLRDLESAIASLANTL